VLEFHHREPEHFIGDEIKCTIIYLCPCVFFSRFEGIWMTRRQGVSIYVQCGNGKLIQQLGTKAPFIWSRVPKTTHPRVTLDEVTLSLFLCKINQTVYIRFANPSREARQLGWASCLTSPGRVTLASGATSLHIKCRVSRHAWILDLKQEFVSQGSKLTRQNPLRANDRGKLEERGISVHLIIQWRLWIIMKGALSLDLQGLHFHI